MLLETCLRYGEISYKAEDVKIWDQKWQPSQRAVQDLDRDWKTVRLANVQFIANYGGGATYRVFEVKFPNTGFCLWLRSMIAHSPGVVICTGACLAGMIIFCVWRMLNLRQGEPDISLEADYFKPTVKILREQN